MDIHMYNYNTFENGYTYVCIYFYVYIHTHRSCNQSGCGANLMDLESCHESHEIFK